MQLGLQPELQQHLGSALEVPSRWALLRARSELDLACVVYARRCLLNPETDFYVHLRADSSPQGGRDWFLVELDICRPGAGPAGVSITPRMMALGTIGARAASATHKGRQLMRILGLESGDLRTTIDRTMSILVDFGAEAGLWTLQDPSDMTGMSRLFSRALPIADADHALHHIMSELDASFESWGDFRDTLSAAARAFGSFHRLDRFREVCILGNPAVAAESKQVFEKLFKDKCPQFVLHRWQYLYETLHWLIPRQAALRFLNLEELGSRDEPEKLTSRDLDLLRALTEREGDSVEALKFWALAAVTQQLAYWGHRVSGVLHGCPCHPKRRGKRRLPSEETGELEDQGQPDLHEPAR